MKTLILATIFTFICKPGMIYMPDSRGLCLFGNDSTYYYWDVELDPGAYMYVSNEKDTVRFYSDGNNITYVSNKPRVNSEFVLHNKE